MATSPQTPSPAAPGEAVLAELRPFLREVRILQPGQPPILGGTPSRENVPLPDGLAAIPSQRWTVTPRIEAFHRDRLSHQSNAELRQEEGVELLDFIGPLLARHFAGRAGMNVVELGPATSTTVPTALKDQLAHYFGMDLSVPFLERSRDLLTEEGYRIPSAYPVLGDTFHTPFEDGVADLVLTSCHPPFVSASPPDMLQAMAEVRRILKPGGEFWLFPWTPGEAHPAVEAWLNSHFELVETHASPLGDDRQLLVLRRPVP
ncbi:MAG: class I SAM-dependent methyltransferase [Armatimonadetes bacterium]|nr:class I SAM-dependent methyltransferase [Armatimonadota bacterium]